KPRDDRRVVQQHREEEENPDREQDCRRVAADADTSCDRVQAVAPGRKPRERESGEQPQERVALTQPVAPDQLEHDEDEREGRNRPCDGDGERSHSESSCGTTLRRKRPTKIASKTLTM